MLTGPKRVTTHRCELRDLHASDEHRDSEQREEHWARLNSSFGAITAHAADCSSNFDEPVYRGWPEKFLKTYAAAAADLHDDSMDDCKFAARPGPEDDGLDSIRKLVARMGLASYSTAFSGVDSPGTAYAMLRAAAGHILQDEVLVAHPRYMHAVDACPMWDNQHAA